MEAGHDKLYEFRFFCDSRLEQYKSLISEQAQLKALIANGGASTYQKERFNQVNQELSNFGDGVAASFLPVEHGLKESALTTILTDDLGKYNPRAQKLVEWYLGHQFGGVSIKGRVYPQVASPENEYFERNYNKVVYQETINDLDALSLILTPVGLDFLADGTAAIYATLYGEYGEALAYGIALAPFVGEVGKGTVKAFVQGARKVRKATRNYELMPRGYLFSGLGWDKILNSPALNKLRGMKLSEPLERQLYEDLKDLKLRKAINDNPELIEGWKVLENLGMDKTVKTNIHALEDVNKLSDPSKLRQVITNKDPFDDIPDDAFIKGNPIFDSKGLASIDGKLINNRLDYVIDLEGNLILGSKHHLLGKGRSVQAAGSMKFRNGKIVEIDNDSGHYLPTIKEGLNFPNIVREQGANLEKTKFSLYHLVNGKPKKGHYEILKD